MQDYCNFCRNCDCFCSEKPMIRCIIHPSTATFVAIATVFAVGLSSEY